MPPWATDMATKIAEASKAHAPRKAIQRCHLRSETRRRSAPVHIGMVMGKTR